jgi:hypothetical protein
MTSPNALHSAKTPKWGTPKDVIEAARELLGYIHLDPGSSDEFNTLVKALMIYTEQTNGLAQEWYGNVFCNPPGGLVNEFWRKLSTSWLAGTVPKAFWVGFSVEQLCTLASEMLHPLVFSKCILRKRLSFNHENLTPGKGPSHGNYVTAIGCDPREFERIWGSKGKISHGKLVQLSSLSLDSPNSLRVESAQ